MPNNGQLKNMKTTANNKKQLVGNLGREGNKPATTECILKQSAPTNLGYGKLEVHFPGNFKKNITFLNSCVKEGNCIEKYKPFLFFLKKKKKRNLTT